MKVECTKPRNERVFARVLRATRCSLRGLGDAWQDERAFRWEVFVAVPLLVVACLLPASPEGRALLAGSILLVLIAELGNTAIEAAIDCTASKPHPLARKAKDTGSAMVMLALLLCAATWLLVLFG